MRLAIGAVGRMKAGPETELLERYSDRARKAGKAVGITELAIREIAESRAAKVQARRDEEAANLLKNLAPEAFIVCLDESGRALGSEALSRLVQSRLDDGTSEIGFLIGGPDGHGGAVRQRASLTLAFGSATWPHQLVRVMLAEQLYRAVTILTGHPYHRA
ncbi:MAG: 23S rRNA (pseudouridine(1915)-N(3))-methyltransferase RlmH [Salaquimonas sp.]|jgi:23S rRNA (pseudouridine1915-N3)-methyltransferase|nr:23S rRNA (pseudouridine(1915)-N(3))-methyltransferase RlmH [Salaquimonas sp.]